MSLRKRRCHKRHTERHCNRGLSTYNFYAFVQIVSEVDGSREINFQVKFLFTTEFPK